MMIVWSGLVRAVNAIEEKEEAAKENSDRNYA